MAYEILIRVAGVVWGLLYSITFLGFAIALARR